MRRRDKDFSNAAASQTRREIYLYAVPILIPQENHRVFLSEIQ